VVYNTDDVKQRRATIMFKKKKPKGYLLLVEDEPDIQIMNRQILMRRGYEMRQAYTVAEAKALVAEQAPRAVVLDIMLPDGSGLDFLKELREGKLRPDEPSMKDIPVLMLTALGTRDDIIRGLQEGGDDYLPKPYELAVFLARIEKLMEKAGMR
jgi:DNA-binding response OmpR family regulator